MRRLARFLGLFAAIVLVLLLGFAAHEIRDATRPIDDVFPFRSEADRTAFLERYDERARAWPLPSREIRVDTAAGSTFVRIAGPETAPPLVLLHGIGGSSLHWIPNIEDLAASFRVFAVDNVFDKGRSVPNRPLRRAEDLDAWLDELLEELSPNRPPHLVGLSYGGWLAARAATRAPDRVAGLVLLAPVATVRPLSPGWMARAAVAALPFEFLTERFVVWLAEDLARTDEGRARLRQHAADAFLANRSYRPMPVPPPTVFPDERLAELPARTLVLLGENEKIYDPREVVARLERVAPRVRTIVLDDAGHDLTLVRPATVDRHIVDFLREVEETSTARDPRPPRI